MRSEIHLSSDRVTFGVINLPRSRYEGIYLDSIKATLLKPSILPPTLFSCITRFVIIIKFTTSEYFTRIKLCSLHVSINLFPAPSHCVSTIIKAVIASIFTSHLDPYFYSSMLAMGSEPVGTGVESCRLSVPFVLLLWCRLCPKVRAPSDGLLLCTALNCMRQRQISVNRRKAVFCGAFRAEASEWLDEKWPLRSPEWDNEQQSESLGSSCTKKQWDFIFVLTILIDGKKILYGSQTNHTDRHGIGNL